MNKILHIASYVKKRLNSSYLKIRNVTNCIIPFVTEHVLLYIFKATLISLSIIFFKHSKGMFNYVSIVGRIYINALYIPFENIIFLFYFKNLPPPPYSTQLFLYSICLQDILKSICIVETGKYFFRFYNMFPRD